MSSAIDFLPSSRILLMSCAQQWNRKSDPAAADASWKVLYVTYLLLRLLCSVQGTTLLAILHTLGIEGATNDVVTNTRQILDTAAAHEHNGVLLQVVPSPGM